MGGDVVQVDGKTTLVFPGRGGVLRGRHNFNRTWRGAHGTLDKDVTQYTFRKTVATLIAEGRMRRLWRSGQGTPERGRRASAELAPDSTAVVEKGLGWTA
ncbi:hypothetical protein IU483_28695 [Streptomyces gardneri]|nr:hypothetical protein [Streptomyces gardneri]